MTATQITKGRWYPQNPPTLPGETDEQYTNRLTGADQSGRRPYDHRRNRQCSIGWHLECSDRDHSGKCECPHHDEMRYASSLAAEFNQRHPVGTVVEFVDGCDEPPVRVLAPAEVDEQGWPVVQLDTFGHAVKLSWLKP